MGQDGVLGPDRDTGSRRLRRPPLGAGIPEPEARYYCEEWEAGRTVITIASGRRSREADHDSTPTWVLRHAFGNRFATGVLIRSYSSGRENYVAIVAFEYRGMAVFVLPSPIMVNGSFDHFDRREQRFAVLARKTRNRWRRHEIRTITPISLTISARRTARSV